MVVLLRRNTIESLAVAVGEPSGLVASIPSTSSDSSLEDCTLWVDVLAVEQEICEVVPSCFLTGT